MNIQKEIADLKGAFTALGEEIKMRFSNEPAPAEFGELTLVDGTIIKYEGDTPAEGLPLIVVTPEGEVPAPDGVHETDSGLLISTKDGVIVSIEEKQIAVDNSKPVTKEELQNAFANLQKFQVDENVKVVLKALMDYCFGWEIRAEQEKTDREAAIAVYKQGFATQEDVAAVKKATMDLLGKVEETFAVFEQFSNQTPAPAAKPFGHTKVEKNEALASFANSFKNLKK